MILSEKLMQRDVVHIVFHSIREREDEGFGDPWTTPERLKTIVGHLLENDWTILSCAEFVSKRDQGELDPAKRYATISFDDGYRDNLAAAQILHGLGVRATFFIISSTIRGIIPVSHRFRIVLSQIAPHLSVQKIKDSRMRLRHLVEEFLGDHPAGNELFTRIARVLGLNEQKLVRTFYLTKKEIRGVEALDMEIGSHSVHHLFINELSLKDAKKEIAASHQEISAVASPPRSFAWPYGAWETTPEKEEKLFSLASKIYESGWGYHRIPVAIRENERWAISRIDEAAFEDAIGIAPLP
ncbi:MAG: Polysaccharide deacetylase [Parcubacteria group bacterium GW2011_GWB1_50_9]|uniref:Polysaccharide deacetylase n=1 Tax=Candidatus Kaiserbacteria bacterium GW2011_GWC2_52_8b TaxID=1618676 RepID=A0A0G1ZTZ6_9BACT|nr:MAG: Polysaccharide deacetylase [Parcubacteria group bacterium GW2011_GWB1_50_9]KKW24974.1 MAG: Polysaccharide deacetylase [candidate division Kazan bacterium GW2011_GWC1_52_13]KKW31782.1 MAG: Polysaccharide deacetylase [Candidatus Kaiserbacteria bacterium GW2011_GWC2_52_8b]